MHIGLLSVPLQRLHGMDARLHALGTVCALLRDLLSAVLFLRPPMLVALEGCVWLWSAALKCFVTHVACLSTGAMPVEAAICQPETTAFAHVHACACLHVHSPQSTYGNAECSLGS